MEQKLNLKRKYYIQPSMWFKKLGQPCQYCKKKLITAQAVTVCSCLLFCHERCFVKSFSNNQNLTNDSIIICKQCQISLEFIKVFTYKILCMNDLTLVFLKLSILMFLLIFVGMFFTFFDLGLISALVFYLASSTVIFIFTILLILLSVQKRINPYKTQCMITKLHHSLILDKANQTIKTPQTSSTNNPQSGQKQASLQRIGRETNLNLQLNLNIKV